MRKGLFPIIAVILVLIMAIFITVFVIIWLPKLAFETYPEEALNKSYMRSRACLSIENVEGFTGSLTLKNCGKIPLTDFKFFIDGNYISNLGLEKLEPLESVNFFELPIGGGEHDLYITSDYAETQPYKATVPFWTCTGGEPPSSGNWYITDNENVYCECSYNSVLPVGRNLYVQDNARLTLYKCILEMGKDLGDNYAYSYIEDRGFLNLTRSRIRLATSDSNYGTVNFNDNSTAYIFDSVTSTSGTYIREATNVTAINSDLGSFTIISDIPHNLSISGLYTFRESGTPSNWDAYNPPPFYEYIKAQGSNYTINLTNVTRRILYVEVHDETNLSVENSTVRLQIYSEKKHNVTLRNFPGGFPSTDTTSVEVQGSKLAFNWTNSRGGWASFNAQNESNNTLINCSFAGFSTEYYSITNNTLINSTIYGNMYWESNTTGNLINSSLTGGGTWVMGTQWGGSDFMTINLSNTKVNRQLAFESAYSDPNDQGNITIFGTVNFTGATIRISDGIDIFYANVTRYFPTTVKHENGMPLNGNAEVVDNFGNLIWQGTVVDGYTEPVITFNRSNYGAGNFTLYVNDGSSENNSDIYFLINTPNKITVEDICDYYIFSGNTPYTITENNSYYCLNESFNINDQTAINFSSGVQNSTLNCLGHTIDGNDASNKHGVHLTGSNTKNNTVKNCIITDFNNAIYLNLQTYNNSLINNTVSGSTNSGIYLSNSDNNILINNIANGNSRNGISLFGGDNNILIDNTANGNSWYGISLETASYNNDIKGGSIYGNSIYDYYLQQAGTNNNFTTTNFTAARKIYFYDSANWFNYNNEITGNIWLKTKVSSTATIITRNLVNWNQNLIQWSDNSSSTTTATYNITGFETNTAYYVYNNSILAYTLDSGSEGKISFTIDLPQNQEHEIKVEKTSDIVLWFKFNESRGTAVSDSSPYGNNGVFNGAIFYHGTLGSGTSEPSWKSGTDCKYGSCLAFEGTPNVNADVVDLSDIPNGSLTIMAWIYPKEIEGDERAIVSKWANAGGGNGEWLFRLDDSQSSEMHFIMYNTSGGYEEKSSSGADIEAGSWTHVAVTYNRSTGQVSFYANASPVGVRTFIGPMKDDTGIVKIGSQGYGTLDPFNGTIDEVRIWNRSLTGAEIQAEMNSHFPASRPLIALSFDEGSGQYTNDTNIWANGTFGSALAFDGDVDYVNAGNDNSLDLTKNLTIIAWIYPITWGEITSDYGRIIEKTSTYIFFIAKDSNLNRLSFYYWNNTGNSNQVWSNNYVVDLNKWQHVAVTYDGQIFRFYVDGSPVGQTTKNAGLLRITSNSLYVGNNAALNRAFDGFIDEPKIWNKALTQTQIQTEMSQS